MIVNVEKCLVIGAKEDLDLFFVKAQEQGLFEFLQPSSKRSHNLPKSVQDLLTAIKILSKEREDVEVSYGKEFTVEELVSRVIFLKNTLEKYSEEKRVLAQEIVAISHFGEFSFEEMMELQSESHRVIQFFFRTHNKKDKELPSQELIYISSDAHAEYYLGVHEEPCFFPDFVEMHFDREPLELKKRLEQIEYDLKNYQKELRELTGYQTFLRESFLHELNKHHLNFAKQEIEEHFDGQVFSVEAWIPKEDLSKADELTQDLNIHIGKIAIEKTDRIPTCMKNKGLNKVGEDLLQIYDVPSHRDKDPSGFVVLAFAIFFAMIVSDAGYGMIYFLLALFANFKLSKKAPVVKRMTKLFLLISSCCVIWGVLIGSYFGISLHPQNPLQKFSLLQELIVKKAAYHMQLKDSVYQQLLEKVPVGVKIDTPLDFLLSVKKQNGSTTIYPIIEEFNNDILMEIAILVGVIHIIISLCRYMNRNLAAIGWVCFIIGGYLFFPSILDNATSLFHFLGWIPKKVGNQIGYQMVYIGIGVAWVLALIQHKIKGIEEPLKSIQIFADILSYLRLYALSLAGMIMAGTFNQLGQEAANSFGYVVGFFIIVIGHMINMTVGVMGGVIHGLRLNFLEWYHYSFEGDGKLFNPLRILK